MWNSSRRSLWCKCGFRRWTYWRGLIVHSVSLSTPRPPPPLNRGRLSPDRVSLPVIANLNIWPAAAFRFIKDRLGGGGRGTGVRGPHSKINNRSIIPRGRSRLGLRVVVFSCCSVLWLMMYLMCNAIKIIIRIFLHLVSSFARGWSRWSGTSVTSCWRRCWASYPCCVWESPPARPCPPSSSPSPCGWPARGQDGSAILENQDVRSRLQTASHVNEPKSMRSSFPAAQERLV